MSHQTTTHRKTVHGALVIVLTIAFGNVAAQTIPKEGNYDYVSCYSGTVNFITFSKTHSASTYELIGNSRTSPPGGPFDMLTFRCLGMGSSLDNQTTSTNYCEAIDKDGDKLLVRNVNIGQKGTQEGLAGTGKYEGIVRSGINEFLGVFPAIKPGTLSGCNRQIGTYKIK